MSQSAINHFDLLSAATFILNKPKITKEEIVEAGAMLEKFSNDFQLNLHILNHYSLNVLNSGPLWAQSMFGFESRMGDFKKCQRSKVCIAESIAKKYCLNVVKVIKLNENDDIVMLRGKMIDVERSVAKIFIEFGLSPINGLYEISYETRIKNEVYKSTSSLTTKSIDYCVKMKDDNIGLIEFFVKHNKIVYLLSLKYEISHRKYHLSEVKLQKPIERQLYRCDDIATKLIYLNYGSIEVVASEPNNFEKT